ncbi:MAG: bifunctional folylpolyglutamate synthase/dihydrofolate synthase [Clostridiales bacterium]|nr:bifunctional folylpolyglutamate synthase/dihydrofolate synthase [Clostridiales bacterium]
MEYIQNANLYGSKKNNLDNIIALLSRLGNPHHRLKFIHVAGTNGKGSTCAMLESVLRHSDYKTGLFTSPYLEHFTERIKINGENVNEDLFSNVASNVILHAKQMVTDGFSHPTFFELVTVCAFLIFLEQEIDIAIIEVGVGGLFDSTNVIDPDLCVITSIGLDHMHVLGSTIEDIARQKAGIIKSGCPTVISTQDSPAAYAEILYSAKQMSAPVYSAFDAKLLINKSGLKGQEFHIDYQGINMDLKISLIGKTQITNATTAFISCLVLKDVLEYGITYESIRLGLSETIWPGRMEVINDKNPLIIIDGAHNQQAAQKLSEEFSNLFPNNKCVLLCGIMNTKDIEGISKELIKISDVIVTTTPLPNKSIDSKELADIMSEYCDSVYDLKDVSLALDKAINLAQKNNAPLLVAGSLYLSGKVRSIVLNG